MDYKIEYFKKYNDNRGQLVVFLKKSDLNKKDRKFGQIYFVTFSRKGVVRGNHYHKRWREWFGIVEGKLEVILKNIKTGEQKILLLDSADNKYIRLSIGPYIAHAFKSICSKTSLVNYANDEWSKNDSIPYKLI